MERKVERRVRSALAGLATLAALLVLLEGLPGRRVAHVSASDASPEAPIVWTELGPAGLIARAITRRAGCPEVIFDGRPEPMQERARATLPDFPVLVCEAAVPAGTRFALIERQRLPLLTRNPERIVVIGDAGCRIEGDKAQACNDPAQWPFANIARRAAHADPDLVIHVGDYIYREDPCPPGNEGCAGSPYGHTWAALQADLFTPARPLLHAAPWVFLRGNHETCARGGEAWFRFLYPLPKPPSCVDYTEPYKISLGTLDLLVLDSAITNDFEEPPDQVAAFTAQFDALRHLATRESWLITHKPLYVFGHAGVQNGVEQLRPVLRLSRTVNRQHAADQSGPYATTTRHGGAAATPPNARPPPMAGSSRRRGSPVRVGCARRLTRRFQIWRRTRWSRRVIIELR